MGVHRGMELLVNSGCSSLLLRTRSASSRVLSYLNFKRAVLVHWTCSFVVWTHATLSSFQPFTSPTLDSPNRWAGSGNDVLHVQYRTRQLSTQSYSLRLSTSNIQTTVMHIFISSLSGLLIRYTRGFESCYYLNRILSSWWWCTYYLVLLLWSTAYSCLSFVT